MSSRTNKAFKGTVASFLQYGVFIILQTLLAPLVLKTAGQEVLGAYSILMQMIGYGILLDLGFSVALGRYLSQAYGLPDQDGAFVEIFNIGRVFLLATNTVFASFIFLSAFLISDFIVASASTIVQARSALCFLAVWTIIRTPLALYNHGLIATQNMAAANIITIIGNMSRLLLSLALVYTGFGLIGLIAANIFSEALTFAVQMRYFKKQFPSYSFGWKIRNYQLFKEIFSFGAKYWGVNLSVVLFLGSDSIVVGNLYGAGAASVYYTTRIPAFLLMQFVFRLSDSAGPATNELLAQRNYGAVISAYLKILRYSLLLVLPLAIGIVGFNKDIITAWVGPKQYAGNVMSLALATFVLTQVLNHVNAMITLAVGNMRLWATISIITSIASLALSYILGKIFGMQWVMVAIALMDLPNLFFLFIRCLHGLKLSVERLWREAIRPALLACLPLCGLVMYLKSSTTQLASVQDLIIFIASFTMVWTACVLLVGLTNSEKELLRNKLSSAFKLDFKIT